MKKLILHVGLPKTGSSAMQTCLNEQRGLLKGYGFDYPVDSQISAMPKHQSLVGGLMKSIHSSLEGFIANNTGHTLILSAEGLTNHLYDYSDESLSEFRKITKTYDLIVYIVIRDKESWTRSYYTQAVLNPSIGTVNFYATSMFLDEFSKHPRIVKLLNKQQLINDVKQAYGANKVVVGDYSLGWFKNFCKDFRLDFIETDLRKRINASPQPWTIELMRQINVYKLPEPVRTSWKAVLQEYSQSNHTILKRSLQRSGLLDISQLNDSVLDGFYPVNQPWFSLNQDQIDGFVEFVKRKAHLN